MIGGRSPGVLRGRGAAAARTRRRPGAPRRRRRRAIGLRRPSPRLLIATALLLAVLAGAWLWVRDSSLVAVQRVRVAGASGPDAARIRAALSTAARNMTTLDVQMGQLQTAVAPYPVVKRLDVQTQFPHGMTIHVVEQVPVAIVAAGGRRIAVSGDGTLLHEVTPAVSLPTITLGIPPGGGRLKGYALSEVRLLAAAPYPLLAKVSQVSDEGAHGLVAQLRNGPSLYFGDSGQLAAKWTAAVAVLANPSSAGAVYVDVTDPGRPAPGVGADSNHSPSPATPATSVAAGSTATTPAATSTTAAPTAAAAGG